MQQTSSVRGSAPSHELNATEAQEEVHAQSQILKSILYPTLSDAEALAQLEAILDEAVDELYVYMAFFIGKILIIYISVGAQNTM